MNSSQNESLLTKLIEHNNWANLQIILACSVLNDEQLDAKSQSTTKGSIRSTLLHLVASQRGYLSMLTQVEEAQSQAPLTFAELQETAEISGEGLLTAARDEANTSVKTKIQAKDGFIIVPWVIFLQVINHATEHREQIKSMLSDLGISPPTIDGWSYGEFTNAYAER
ncbi:MAG: DinB family protein [Anaerolineales bacterium]